MRVLGRGLLAAGLVATMVGNAQAAPIAYDGIQYPASPLLAEMLAGNGPAFGFSAPWAAVPSPVLVTEGLASPLALPSAGACVGGNGDFQAPLSSPIAPSPGKEFWASFLISQAAGTDQTFMGLSPAGTLPGTAPSVAFGVKNRQYGIFVGGVFTASAVTPDSVTDLLVMHFAAGSGGWNTALYVNGVPALAMTVAPVTYGMMVNYNHAIANSDEFRLGDTAADVSAAPVAVKGTTWGRLKQLYR